MPVRSPRLGPWKLAAPFGIELKDQVWNTGSVYAVCPLSHDRLLIGAEQGGLWVSEPDVSGSYQSRCVSDAWDHWGFVACVQDPADPDRIFFGTAPGVGGAAGLYLGNFGAQTESWTPVPLPPSLLGSVTPNLPNADASGVASMIILPLQRLLVVATSAGVAWMQIDSQPFVWQSAQHSITDLANLPGDDFLFVATTFSGEHSTQASSLSSLNKGSIIGGANFVPEPIPQSAIRWTKRRGHATHPPIVFPLRIASCKAKPEHVYCLGSIQRADIPSLFVIRSRDSGKTWQECSYATGRSSETLADVLDFADFDAIPGPKSPKSLAVHPVNPEILAAGFRDAALSTDGGNLWISLANLEGWHRDIHRLLFHLEAPTKTIAGSAHQPRRYSLYIPSDGGILRWTGTDTNASIAEIPLRADSSRNRSLPIVMLYSPDARFALAFGNVSVAAGVVAAGSQDNSNLWFDAQNPQWRLVAGGGDGGAVAVSSQGVVPAVLYSQPAGAIRVAHRTNSSSWGQSTVVPIRLSANTLDGTGIIPRFLRPVGPGIGLTAGEGRSPVIALASSFQSNVVYAAVIKSVLDPGALVSQEVEWIIFGQIPSGEIVSCLEVHNNTSVLVGTDTGRVFLLKERASPSEASFNHKPAQPIKGIASNGTAIACFATSQRTSSKESGNPTSSLYMGRFKDRSAPKTTRRWFDLVFVETSAFPRNDHSATFHSICANRSKSNSSLSFALTVNENEVWVFPSGLSNWRRAFAGLPHAIRCSDVVFSESAKGGELWLSSYGRAVWRLLF